MKILKSLYINDMFFWSLLGIAVLSFVSFFVDWLYPVAAGLLALLLLLLLVDIFVLFSGKNSISASRVLPEMLSNGDKNSVWIKICNNYRIPVYLRIIDEVPCQYQKRDFLLKSRIGKFSEKEYEYTLRPVQRGEYLFGKLNIFVLSPLQLAMRRYIFSENAIVAAYPSFIQMKKYDLIAFSHNPFEYGLKKIRRIGHTMEFEQIKEYVQGDDIRTINWKATSKKAQLMVNQYQEEKSQPVYLLIDKGRSMQMPFDGMSLLDWAINSSLALSNIVIRKQDKAGLFTFSKKVEDRVPANRQAGQMQKIMNALYRIETNFFESDFNRLYVEIKQSIAQRSLLILYTNFETTDALQRQLPYLKAISKNHLLIVIFFKNTELDRLIDKRAEKLNEVYDKIIAEKFTFEKRVIVQELTRHGIQCILSSPENLTIDSINKYLEIKARGMV
ncbi:DUF58 domain-containing protein [Proteiniphilum acetatigenes]|uniref:DUF58 domain-containing protein n=1 Tax=Proteiniphilum acetatigenes TaxID=294710 RepID=UPI000377A3F1|nr:DUF58 domain-containing protein [Proteiniphilum acetatigenes]